MRPFAFKALRSVALVVLALSSTGCDTWELIGLLPFGGQAQVSLRPLLRVDYGDRIDLDALPLLETVALEGPFGEVGLEFVDLADGVARFQPVDRLGEDSTYTLRASVLGLDQDQPLPVEGAAYHDVEGGWSTFSTGGECVPLTWEAYSPTEGAFGKVLFSCPPARDWVEQNLRFTLTSDADPLTGFVPLLFAEADYPHIFDAFAPDGVAGVLSQGHLWTATEAGWDRLWGGGDGWIAAARGHRLSGGNFCML